MSPGCRHPGSMRRQSCARGTRGTGRCGRRRRRSTLTGLQQQQRDQSGPTGSVTRLGQPERGRSIALLPAKIKAAGKLVVGVNPPYSPNEYLDSSGKIVGFDVDLMDATAEGPRPDDLSTPQADFDKIIPAITAGTYDVGMSSFTDNKEREKTVDFVDLLQRRHPLGVAVGQDRRPGQRLRADRRGADDDDRGHRRHPGPEQGLHRRRQAGDQQAAVRQPGRRDQRGRSSARPTRCRPTRRSPRTRSSRAAASCRRPARSPSRRPTAGRSRRARRSVQALQKAVQSLIDNGTYDQICKKWGVESGEIKTAQINGATS